MVRFSDGLAGCRAYSHDLITQAVSLLAAEWRLEAGDFAAPPEMGEHLGMALVLLNQAICIVLCHLSAEFLFIIAYMSGSPTRISSRESN